MGRSLVHRPARNRRRSRPREQCSCFRPPSACPHAHACRLLWPAWWSSCGAFSIEELVVRQAFPKCFLSAHGSVYRRMRSPASPERMSLTWLKVLVRPTCQVQAIRFLSRWTRSYGSCPVLLRPGKVARRYDHPHRSCPVGRRSSIQQRSTTAAGWPPGPNGCGSASLLNRQRLADGPCRARARCPPTPRTEVWPRHRASRARRGRQWDAFRSCTGVACFVIRSCSMRRALANWLRLVLSPQPISSAISAWS